MRHSIHTLEAACLLTFLLVNTSAYAEKNTALSVNCQTTVTSGSGPSFMQVCISDHGNILTFRDQAANQMHSDGYALADGCTNYFDFGRTLPGGWSESGWGASTISQPGVNKLPLTITRKTTDGKFKLVQVFTQNAAERELSIEMKITNQSGQVKYLWTSRAADIDANGGAGNDIFDTTGRTLTAHEATATQPNKTGGLLLTTVTPAPWGFLVHKLINFNPTGCGAPPNESTPFQGADAIGQVAYELGNVANGATKTVKLKYQLY